MAYVMTKSLSGALSAAAAPEYVAPECKCAPGHGQYRQVPEDVFVNPASPIPPETIRWGKCHLPDGSVTPFFLNCECPSGYVVMGLYHSGNRTGRTCRKMTEAEAAAKAAPPPRPPTRPSPAPAAPPVEPPPMRAPLSVRKEEAPKCLPDDMWEALPKCTSYFEKMPGPCKSAEGARPGAEQAACLDYAATAPSPICQDYALMKVTGAPQSAFDALFGMPSCSGKTRAPSEAAAVPSKISRKTLLIGAAVVAGGVLVWKVTRKKKAKGA